jgi:hypothetical protein
MGTTLKIGKKLISPKRAKNRKGTQGIFLTEKEWNTVLTELKINTSTIKKESLFSRSLEAMEEVELYLQGKKKLRNANEAIGEL